MFESTIPTLLELWQLPTALGSMLHAQHPLVKNIFLSPTMTLP